MRRRPAGRAAVPLPPGASAKIDSLDAGHVVDARELRVRSQRQRVQLRDEFRSPLGQRQAHVDAGARAGAFVGDDANLGELADIDDAQFLRRPAVTGRRPRGAECESGRRRPVAMGYGAGVGGRGSARAPSSRILACPMQWLQRNQTQSSPRMRARRRATGGRGGASQATPVGAGGPRTWAEGRGLPCAGVTGIDRSPPTSRRNPIDAPRRTQTRRRARSLSASPGSGLVRGRLACRTGGGLLRGGFFSAAAVLVAASCGRAASWRRRGRLGRSARRGRRRGAAGGAGSAAYRRRGRLRGALRAALPRPPRPPRLPRREPPRAAPRRRRSRPRR